MLVDFDFNPKSVDVTTGPATVTYMVNATDVPAGVQNAQINIRWASGTAIGYGCPLSAGRQIRRRMDV